MFVSVSYSNPHYCIDYHVIYFLQPPGRTPQNTRQDKTSILRKTPHNKMSQLSAYMQFAVKNQMMKLFKAQSNIEVLRIHLQ